MGLERQLAAGAHRLQSQFDSGGGQDLSAASCALCSVISPSVTTVAFHSKNPAGDQQPQTVPGRILQHQQAAEVALQAGKLFSDRILSAALCWLP